MLQTEPGAPVAIGLSNDHAGWPWEAEPYRLWSLLDMERFFGSVWIAILRDLEHAQHMLLVHEESSRQHLAVALKALLEEGATIPLRQPFILQAERVQRYVESAMDNQSLSLLASELRENLMGELAEYLFFVVPPSRKWLYLDPERWFDKRSLVSFPAIGRDVRDACQCYALAQWTATVFHAMRILEHGLRWLATAVELAFATSVELEQWKTILDQIEKRIRDMEQLPKSPQKSADVQFYAEAAIQFRLFKDAWRNHVSHARASYDEQDAYRVLMAVKDFMAHLAKRL